MKIAFDARMIDHPGIGRYIRNLLNAVFALNTKHEFVLFGNKNKLSDLNPQLSADRVVEYNAPIYSLQEQLFQPFNSYDFDLLHCPHFNIPYAYKGKLIVTIHDLIHIKFPQYLPLAKKIIARPLIKSTVKKANKIISVSENTKKDIIDIFPACAEKIKVIYEAADSCFFKNENIYQAKQVRKKYNLPGKFILFVGSLKEHKNLKTAIQAFLIFKRNNKDVGFVVVGRNKNNDKKLFKLMDSAGAIYFGEIAGADLNVIYSLSSVLLHPSLYEGFGLTVLEAMACKTPVVCSDAASLPEVAQNAALLFNPHSPEDMAKKLNDVFNDTGLRDSLIEKGLVRVKEFSWQKCAEETLNVYEEVLRCR